VLDVIVRPPRPDELSACANFAAVELGGIKHDWLGRFKGDLEIENRHILCAFRDDAIAGYGRIKFYESDGTAKAPPSGWYLGGLLVAKQHRGSGLGRLLTVQRLQWLSVRTTACYYFTNSHNTASLSLHASFGFTEVTRDIQFPGVEFAGGVGVFSGLTFREEA